jgi:hypothetical protein
MNIKYIGTDVHKETISIAVMNGEGKVVMESIIETKARRATTPKRRSCFEKRSTWNVVFSVRSIPTPLFLRTTLGLSKSTWAGMMRRFLCYARP